VVGVDEAGGAAGQGGHRVRRDLQVERLWAAGVVLGEQEVGRGAATRSSDRGDRLVDGRAVQYSAEQTVDGNADLAGPTVGLVTE